MCFCLGKMNGCLNPALPTGESQREEVSSQLHTPAWSESLALDPLKIFSEHRKHMELLG